MIEVDQWLLEQEVFAQQAVPCWTSANGTGTALQDICNGIVLYCTIIPTSSEVDAVFIS